MPLYVFARATRQARCKLSFELIQKGEVRLMQTTSRGDLDIWNDGEKTSIKIDRIPTRIARDIRKKYGSFAEYIARVDEIRRPFFNWAYTPVHLSCEEIEAVVRALEKAWKPTQDEVEKAEKAEKAAKAKERAEQTFVVTVESVSTAAGEIVTCTTLAGEELLKKEWRREEARLGDIRAAAAAARGCGAHIVRLVSADGQLIGGRDHVLLKRAMKGKAAAGGKAQRRVQISGRPSAADVSPDSLAAGPPQASATSRKRKAEVAEMADAREDHRSRGVSCVS